MLTFALIAVLVGVGIYLGFRFGLPPGWPHHNTTAEISFKDDWETDGFKSDFSRYEQPPDERERAPGPGWDS